MTEPKYTVGDWVQLNSGFVTEIDSIVTKPDDDEPFYYMSFGDSESVPESDIKCAVAIHPIEHHKCKDCEYAVRDCVDDLCYTIECPKGMPANYGSLINWLKGEPAVLAEKGDESEPPPNCYCFTPKLSPDEKESK